MCFLHPKLVDLVLLTNKIISSRKLRFIYTSFSIKRFWLRGYLLKTANTVKKKNSEYSQKRKTANTVNKEIQQIQSKINKYFLLEPECIYSFHIQ